jgi:phage repressor protein C with HTH and peptisase S24 domain
MISSNRIALNDRFLTVYDMLVERGEIIKSDRSGKGIGDFAKIIMGKRSYGHIIKAYLNVNNKRCIQYEEASRLCEAYGVNKDYLLEGLGKPFGNTQTSLVTLESTTVKTNVTLYSTEAFASDQLDADSFVVEHQQQYRVPGLDGDDYVAFPVKGNSMEPHINNGDIVICKQVESLREIKQNQIYAISSDGKVWIKYIQQLPFPKGSLNKLNLISANHLEHAPIIHEANTSTKIYKVVSRISNFN